MPWISSSTSMFSVFWWFCLGGVWVCLFIAAGRRGCGKKHHSLDTAWSPQLVCREWQHCHPSSPWPCRRAQGTLLGDNCRHRKKSIMYQVSVLVWDSPFTFLQLMLLKFPGLKCSSWRVSLSPTLIQHHQGNTSPWPWFSSHGGEILSWKQPGHAQLRGTGCEEHKRPGNLQPNLHSVLVQIMTVPLKQTSLLHLLWHLSQRGFGAGVKPNQRTCLRRAPGMSQSVMQHGAMEWKQN